MKEYIFNQFVENILAHTSLTKEELFENTRKSEVSLARKFLYKLCIDRGMTIRTIVSYMIKNDFNCFDMTIHQGISSLEKMRETDSDLGIIFNKLSNVEA